VAGGVRPRRSAGLVAAALAVVGCALSGCAAGHHSAPSAAAAGPSAGQSPAPPSPSPSPSPSRSPNPPPSPRRSPPRTAAAAAPPPVHTAAAAPGATGRQLIEVTAAGYGQTTATFTAYQQVGGGWQQVFGPWTAEIGYNGFAPPGQKREGDGRTPSGTYGFGFFFGVDANPGVRFRYRAAYSYDVWDDDPASPLYNEWVDERYANPGRSPEPMDQVPAYDYGAVIAYNTQRTPGAGSAIFLHVDPGGPTAGCVALPTGELLEVLRWLDPARSPVIRMGVG
jgi:L,D-peptidoglycan transpeptidase YkuD (ErfK/YbiS/YcfS/YnhG family)